MGMKISNTIGMKTAISIPDDLFEKVDKLAKETKTSRSRIFCKAVEFYLEKTKSQRLLRELNTVYGREDSPEEKRLRKKSAEYYKNNVLKETDDNQTG
jgi:metal-responsive CopG/Arc/MetJ family transcriptional regulator